MSNLKITQCKGEGQVNRMDKCPHCGSTKGLYSKYTLYGLQRYYGFDGS